MQQVPLLQTKLHIPPLRPELVSRPRLIERLNAGLQAWGGAPRALTLISAPAGFGKTTLLGEWAQQVSAGSGAAIAPQPVAWLSLDESDDDETRFWTYLIAALQVAQSDLGQDALRLLQAPQRPATQVILTGLINQVAALPHGAILVLDDYHVISDPAIHEGLAFLLEHLPPQLHVAISTRADPPLPIHRLRARSRLTELRIADLRFTADEGAAFLNTTMGLGLAAEDVAMLEARTEGWPVGLQLAALSLRDRTDAHEFITTFSGGHHYILEYLVQEVVHRQPAEVQRFLMQTSILHRLCGPLCNAVTGEGHGEDTLAYLRQHNLFILPLDDEHHWYRYHHLFVDLLGNLRRQEWPPELVQNLHRRASEWYARHGLIAEAVHHALAAQDFERTARMIEANSLAMVTRGELTTLLRWIDALPEEVARSRPWLCVHQAWPLTLAGRADAAEPLLRQIEAQVSSQASSPEDAEVLGNAAAMRAMLASMRGDMSRAVELARQADELLPADNLIPRHVIPFVLFGAHLADGALSEASQALTRELEIGLSAGNVWTIVRTLSDLADLELIQGHLGRAAGLCHKALQEAEQRGARQYGTVGYALVKLGEIYHARNDLPAALEHVSEGVTLMQGWQQPYEMVSGYTTLAAVRQAQGDVQGARDALQSAEAIQSQQPNYPKLNSLVRICRVGLGLTQEGPDNASRLAAEARLGDSGTIIEREQEQVLMARILVAQETWDEALPLLARLAERAESGGRFGRLIQILTLQAVTRNALGDTAGALAAFRQALALGEPEGYVRVFVELGPPAVALLQQVITRGNGSQYAEALLATIRPEDEITRAPSVPPTLIEPLTGRELEVLHLLGQGCSNREIAKALVITLNGVKKHTGNIYGKLGVHSRTQAVVRAQELGLL